MSNDLSFHLMGRIRPKEVCYQPLKAVYNRTVEISLLVAVLTCKEHASPLASTVLWGLSAVVGSSCLDICCVPDTVCDTMFAYTVFVMLATTTVWNCTLINISKPFMRGHIEYVPCVHYSCNLCIHRVYGTDMHAALGVMYAVELTCV